MQRLNPMRLAWVALLALCLRGVTAQDAGSPGTPPTSSSSTSGDIRARLEIHLSARAPNGHTREPTPPAVIWLKSTQDSASESLVPGSFTLLQKDKMFKPHLLVVPVGSSVSFPNADPFFHNVFSLFDGKRFDLGLYEAGSTRSIVFSREGVSYIFCNIHPEMSAVVLSLSTPYHSVSDATGAFRIRNVPAGDYELHVWVEGQRQNALDRLTRHIHLTGSSADLGEIHYDSPDTPRHQNKFGQPYDSTEGTLY